MERPGRTASYLATIAQRREELHQALSRILASRSSFVLEVGSGHGHFLAAFAQERPDQLCIGIDIVSERVERAIRKRDRADLSNLHFIRAEARLFLETLPPGATFSDVFVLFPDPWPKARHHKHRILQPAFLDSIASRATPECRLLFRTDHLPYFADAVAAIEAHSRWQQVHEPWPFEFETVFQRRAPAFHSLIARPNRQS